MELWGKEGAFSGAVCPAFFSRSVEPLPVPEECQGAVMRISAAVCYVGCRHSHLLQPNYRSNNRKCQCTPSRPVIPPLRRLVPVPRVVVNDSPFLPPSLQ